MIKITGRLDGENMIFTVTDDGKGMTKEVLEKLQESIGKEKGDKSIDGFGIGNVNRRIRYYYGERYGVTLESVEMMVQKRRLLWQHKKTNLFR